MAKHHRFSQRSKDNLSQVHDALVAVAELALEYTDVDFGVTEGAREEATQLDRLKKGKSLTTRSRHVIANNKCKKACAIDVLAYVKGKGTYQWKYYRRIAKAFFRAAIELGVQIEWGGFWYNLSDGVHFQLSWKDYP